MPNRLFYTVKLNSSLLKDNHNKLTLTFNECLENNLIITLADSQMLRTIRDLTSHTIDPLYLESLYQERDRLRSSKRLSAKKRARISQLQAEIYRISYIPEYITVVMNSPKEYETLFTHGFTFNNHLYKRGSCSASQARVSTVVFIDDSIRSDLHTRLDCGRDLTHPLVPSKYAAYYGLYSSATRQVTKPRFCIVPDFEEEMTHEVDYVIEQDAHSDDIIERRTITTTENRFDGSGLITPDFAAKWAQDLSLDYVPCNFCLRYAFAKGMVNTFDILDWCHVYNNDSYMITDVYNNQIDLREIDVILSAGQVKLYDSWSSQADYERCCEENGIIFGVTKFSPKQDKKVLLTNYQYLQTLDLSDSDIVSLCADTVRYLEGVSYDDPYYSLLFMCGDNMDEVNVTRFLQSSDNYWLKSCILNHDLLKDPYSRSKIRDMLVKKIDQACLGRLIVPGNYVCICPDPFAYMEWICYRDPSRVKGLLGPGECYNQFWNNWRSARHESFTKVDALRSPLTHFSEHGIDTLVQNADTDRWYRYCYSGYINNCHDEFTYVHAGSDWDYDICASTPSPSFVNHKYPDQRVVTYSAKKPKKRPFTEEDLYKIDTFSFGTKIGSITNTTTSFIALMANYSPDSPEYKLLASRVAAGCAAQSREIDRTKIGEKTKTLGTICTQFQRAEETDTPEDIERKDFYNRIIADRKPYFFRHNYKSLDKEIRDYDAEKTANLRTEFGDGVTLQSLLSKEVLTEREKEFIYFYKKRYPVIDSPCVMNKICKYIESIDFHIKQRVRTTGEFDYHALLSTSSFNPSPKILNAINTIVHDEFASWNEQVKTISNMPNKLIKENQYNTLKDKLYDIICSEESLTNYLVYLFYVEHPSYSKSILWSLSGPQIYANIKSRTTTFYFPIRDDNGDMEFLYDKYAVKKLSVPSSEDPDVLNIEDLLKEVYND